MSAPRKYAPGCTVSGCPNKHRSRGLCSTHYNAMKRRERGAEIRHRKGERLCGFPGCDGDYYAKDLCVTHYKQQQRGCELAPIGTWGQRVAFSRMVRERTKAAPVLPKGWERTTTPAPPKRAAGMVTAAELPPVPPTPREVLDAALVALELLHATDLAEMLGLTREAA